MLSDNRIILASAGSGKTTTIVEEACRVEGCRSALITYTQNGRAELSDKAYEMFGAIPANVKINTWYAFILQHFVRPFQNHLYETRVSTINFKRGRTARGVKKDQTNRFFFSSRDRIRLDKVTDFICELIKKTDGLPIQRFEKIFDHLYIDEAQDLSGYDLELIEILLQSSTRITLIGDHRQATFSTNDNPKNNAYWGPRIVNKFEDWAKADLASIEYQTHSNRCIQAICDYADQFYPDFPKTESRNETVTDHDGIFAVELTQIDAYQDHFNSQPLRYNKRTGDVAGRPMNYGQVKGMTFDRTLIYPHGPLLKYLKTGDLKDAGKELPKLYVAVTRARQSVAFVVPDGFKPAHVQLFRFPPR